MGRSKTASAFLNVIKEESIMSYYTEEQIAKARSIDLLTYLQTYESTELVRERAGTFSTLTHDSLKISNGKWLEEYTHLTVIPKREKSRSLFSICFRVIRR